MGLISIGGLGSGLDVTSIIDALGTAERTPKQNSLDRFEADVSVTLTGLGSLSSSLDELRGAALDLSLASNFEKRRVSLSDSSFFSATASSSASPASYQIEVKQLAKGSEDQSKIFAGGNTTTFGDGTLTFTVGVETFDVSVLATDTLETIRNNINEAAGNNFVTVNLLSNITDGTDEGSVLSFNSSTTGIGNDLAVSYTGDATLADLSTGLTQTSAASNATIAIDGFEASSTTNAFNDVIDGVTLNVAKINDSGTTETLTVSLDTANTKSLITSFVDTYNGFVELTKQLGSADENAPGLLLGDYTLRQVSSQIRNLFSSTVESASGSFNSLTALGITSTQEGLLEIDDEQLTEAIDTDFEKLDGLFAGDEGFATRLRDLVDNYTSSSGIIATRETSLNEQLSQIADDRISLDLRIEKLQFRLTNQFAAMDAIVAQFNSTQSYIAQQFENLPGFGGNDS